MFQEQPMFENLVLQTMFESNESSGTHSEPSAWWVLQSLHRHVHACQAHACQARFHACQAHACQAHCHSTVPIPCLPSTGPAKRSASTSRSATARQRTHTEQIEKRTDDIEKIKVSLDLNCICTDRPRTPDPHQDISKRSWERQKMKWRHDIQQCVPPRGDVPPLASARGQFSMPAQEASASISVAKPDSSQEALSMPALQCPACKRELCQTRELCWFYRRNVQDAVEVHLMLRPEVPMPQTLVRATEAKQGAAQSWQCGCGTEIADSRAVGPCKAMMTAFKSSKVMLYGQRYTGKKSMWPSIYNTPPFNNIQVRTRDTFHGVP